MSRAGLTPAARRAMHRALDGAPDAVERVAQKPPAPATRRRARGRSLARAVPLVAFLDDRPRLKHFSLGFLAGACAMAAIAMEEVKRMVAARDDERRRERDARRRARIEKKAVNKLNSVPIIVEMSDEEAGDGIGGDVGTRDEEHKMALLVREDVAMGAGKLAAQAGHAAVGAAMATRDRSPMLMGRWECDGQKKVTLGVKNLRVMNELLGEAKTARLTTFVVEDAGRTEVEPGTVTVAAIGPAAASDIDKITGHLRLY